MSGWRGHGTVPPGWVSLVDALHRLVSVLDPGIEVVQTKQKLGELRYYVQLSEAALGSGWRTEAIGVIVHAVERVSHSLCEVCGANGELCEREGGYRTLCDGHAAAWKQSEWLPRGTEREGIGGHRFHSGDDFLAWLEQAFAEEPHPDPATLDPVPEWVGMAHAWIPEERGVQFVRVSYLDSLSWLDRFGNEIDVTAEGFPVSYARALLGFLEAEGYFAEYARMTGRDPQQAPLVEMLHAIVANAESEGEHR